MLNSCLLRSYLGFYQYEYYKNRIICSILVLIWACEIELTQFQTLVDFQFEMNSIPISEYVLHPFLDDMSVVK